MIQEVEHLKLVVQDILSAFHNGSGILGKPEPINLEIATRMIWNEIDKASNSEQSIPSDQIRLKLLKNNSSLEELTSILEVCGKWVVRSHIRNNNVVAYIVGILNEKTSLGAVLSFLKEKGWEATDLSIGV
jgi:hypothetical protein